MTTTIAALQLVRMSKGWQYMSSDTQEIVDAAIKGWTDQAGGEAETRLRDLTDEIDKDLLTMDIPVRFRDLLETSSKAMKIMATRVHDLETQLSATQAQVGQDLPADVPAPSLLDIVRSFSVQVMDDRTLLDIHDHKMREAKELRDEIVLWMEDEEPGEDGIAGEVADNIACDLDILVQAYPEMTSEEFAAIVTRKCQKWVDKYGGVRLSQEPQS